MVRTTGVRFRQAGKIFYYNALDFDLGVGTYVVVDSAHGVVVGKVVIAPDQVIANESSSGEDPKPILRLATQEDMARMDEMRERAGEVLLRAKKMASSEGLDMTLASGEFDLEGSQFTAYFSSTERVDFRSLVRDLSRELGAKVQLLQVGDRDRAKLVDGFDICGERLCCSSWMTSFPSVSIRMAKEQDLPLNPQKISGVCGRLYCCLTFEYEDYKALRGTLPKVGAMISTPAGEAKVTAIDFNREIVKLYLTEARESVEVAAIDFQLQNGVTIRPMELVRKIESPLRTITEDSATRLGNATRRSTRTRPARPAETAPPPPPAESSTGAKRRRNRRGGSNNSPPAAQSAPQARNQPRQARPAAQPAPQPQAQAQQTGEAASKSKRRRRRRGKGGGGDGTASSSGAE